MEQWDPDTIIMSSRAQDGMVDKVEEYCELSPPSFVVPDAGSAHHQRIILTLGEQNLCKYELQPFKSFTPAQAVARLSNLSVGGDIFAVEMEQEDHNASITSGSDSNSMGNVDRFAKYRQDHTAYAGMGKVRLNMVKLGCWTNVDAPLAVRLLDPHNSHNPYSQQISAVGGLLLYLSKGDPDDFLEETPVAVRGIESMQL